MGNNNNRKMYLQILKDRLDISILMLAVMDFTVSAYAGVFRRVVYIIVLNLSGRHMSQYPLFCPLYNETVIDCIVRPSTISNQLVLGMWLIIP